MRKKSRVQKKNKVTISKEKINQFKEAFDFLDKNKKGIISFKDFLKIRKIFLYPITEKKMNKFVKEIEEYDEGNMNFKGFVDFMKRIIEYVEENDESTLINNIKDEIQKVYLGKKRRRSTTNDRYYNKKKKKKNCDKTYDNIILIEDEDEDNNNDDNFESFYSDNTFNIKKKLNSTVSSKLFDHDKKPDSLNKFNNYEINNDSLFDNINEKKIIGKKKNNNLFKNKIPNQNQPKFIKEINSKNKKKGKKQNQKKNNKPKKASIEDNTVFDVIVSKKSLPSELVNEIECKDKMFIPKINSNNSINNSFNLSQSSLNKKCDLNDSNLEQEYSSSDLNNDSDNKNLNSETHNSPKEKNLLVNVNTINTINSMNSSNDINRSKEDLLDFYSTDKFNDEKMEKIPNLPFKNNNLFRKDFPDNKSRNKMDSSSQIPSHNNSFHLTEHDNNFNFYNNIYLNEVTEITDITSNHYKYNYNINMKNDFVVPKETDNDNIVETEKMEKKSKSKSYEKFQNKNVDVLNILELKYKQNKKKEKIIKSCTEVPYIIIIDKRGINMEEIKNSLPDDSMTASKDKSFSFASLLNNDNNNEKNNENITKPLHLETFQIQINNEANNFPQAKNERKIKNDNGKKEKRDKNKEKHLKKMRTDKKRDINNNQKITSFIIKLRSGSNGKRKNKYFP